MTRYLHDDLLAGLDARQLLADSEDEIRERGVAHRYKDVGSREDIPEIAILLRRWILAGRRVVLVSPLAVAAFDAAPVVPVDQIASPAYPVEIWLERPWSLDTGAKKPLELYGAIVCPELCGPAAILAITPYNDAGFAVLYSPNLCGPEKGDIPPDVLIRKVLRALADEQTAWLEPVPRASRARRQARRSGLDMRQLVLSEDALSVWRRRHLAQREEAEGTRSGSPRGPVSPHEVRACLSRQWVLEPAFGEDILADKLHRPESDDEPAVYLYCVLRPRRGHTRGSGPVRPDVTRLVPAL